jgi:RNA polymerase sigma-70 factor (ECF subfamily)
MLLGAEADEQLAVALSELGEERRQALVMRIDHGLDYDEIADVMGWPLSKVKNEIHRARLVLRTRLSKYVGGQ